jgi:hypothetical protein
MPGGRTSAECSGSPQPTRRPEGRTALRQRRYLGDHRRLALPALPAKPFASIGKTLIGVLLATLVLILLTLAVQAERAAGLPDPADIPLRRLGT